LSRPVRRVAAVYVTERMAQAAPAGLDPRAFLLAVAEDVYELVAGLESVTPVVLSAGVPGLADLTWPGTPVLPAADLTEGFAALAAYGEHGVIVSGDAPDLPPLLIGKLFRELGRAELAVCPAAGGGAVAIAARLPLPSWAEPDLDEPDPIRGLRARAPGRRTVAAGPGWYRLRTPADLGRLDPGLEGWENTRALLGR